MNVSDFLRDPAQAGYMVAVVGARAPSFVHVANTSATAREAAVTEAERLLRTIGRGRALVLRLEAVVDQMPAEFPPSTVKKCMPATIDLPLETVAKIGGEMGALKAEIASLRAAAEKPAPAPLVVREHGIYERRCGEIIKIDCAHPDLGAGERWASSGLTYRGDGSWAGSRRPNGYDLVREIVVGKGWKPWNGGECPIAAGQIVECIRRDGGRFEANDLASDLSTWERRGYPNDIIAYRVSAPTTGAV